MKRLILVLLAITISGCAIDHITPQDARGIPESRVFQQDLLEKHTGLTEIRFIREDAVMSGTGTSANLFLNRKPLAALWAGEKFSIWVMPDLFSIGLNAGERWNDKAVAFSRPESAHWNAEVDARIDRTYEVRIDFTNWTGIALQVSSKGIQK